MKKKKYPRRSKITPLDIERGKAWYAVFKILCEIESDEKFCTLVSAVNDNLNTSDATFISKNPDAARKKWTSTKPPGFDTIEQVAIYLAEELSLYESNVHSHAYLFGPSRMFRGYRLASTTNSSVLIDFGAQDEDWYQREYLFPLGEVNDFGFNHKLLFGPESTRDLARLVHDIFIACETLIMSKHLCHINSNPRFIGLEKHALPGIEGIAGVQLLDAVDALANEISKQSQLESDLLEWGLELNNILTLIPNQFVFLFSAAYPALEKYVNPAMQELAAACSTYAPLYSIVEEITQHNK